MMKLLLVGCGEEETIMIAVTTTVMTVGKNDVKGKQQHADVKRKQKNDNEKNDVKPNSDAKERKNGANKRPGEKSFSLYKSTCIENRLNVGWRRVELGLGNCKPPTVEFRFDKYGGSDCEIGWSWPADIMRIGMPVWNSCGP
jgi:hypothetical protein